MNRIGILSAMWVEAELLASAMENVKTSEYNGMKYYEGTLCGHPTVLSTCGVGKINAAIYTQLMLDRFGVDRLLHTGIAGSLDPAVRHLDVVAAERLTYHDVRRSQLTELFPYREFFETDPQLTGILLQSAKEQCEEKQDGTKAHQGLILTGDAFVTDSEQKSLLKARFPRTLCVEMESCAVAHTAYVNKVPIGIVRCISDLADGGAQEDYAAFEKKAADKAAEIVMRALRKIKK